MQFKFIPAARSGLSLLALVLGASAWAQTNVGVSVSVNQPGFYGRIDIGQQAPPVIYAQPVIIQQSPVAIHQRPIYMRVPPGHSKRWAQYCARYRACGQPVYFVSPTAVIQPAHRHDHDDDRYEQDNKHRNHKHGRDDHHGHGRGHGRD